VIKKTICTDFITNSSA